VWSEFRCENRSGRGVNRTRTSFSRCSQVYRSASPGRRKHLKVKSNEKKPSFLTVGGSGSHAVIVLPEILRAFKQNHPWVQFGLESNDSGTMEQHILNAEVEIALINHPSYSAQIAYEPYKEMEIVAFALAASPFVGKKITLKGACPNSPCRQATKHDLKGTLKTRIQTKHCRPMRRI